MEDYTSKIGELLGLKPDNLSLAIQRPVCPSCGQEYGFFFWKRKKPKKYSKLCDKCVEKQIQEDLKGNDRKKLLLELYEQLDHNSLYRLLTNDDYEEARELYDAKLEEEDHQKYVDEVKALHAKAYEMSSKSGNGVDVEFYALLLQRIDKLIEDNGYKRDPRNIRFTI